MVQTSVTERVRNGRNVEVVMSFSCSTCRKRKVKCDKHNPCSNCVRISKDCMFIPPVRGKRKRTKPTIEELQTKLERYEELLKSYGAKPESSGHGDGSEHETSSQVDLEMVDASPSPRKSEHSPLEDIKAKIIHEDGSSRYIDTNFWSRIRQEFDQPEEQKLVEAIRQRIGGGCMTGPVRQISSSQTAPDPIEMEEHDLVMGVYPDIQNLAHLHPPLETVQKLWEIYCERVDPLVKLLHIPTFWSTLENVIQNPHNVSKGLKALVFAVYTCTFSTLDDDECQQLMCRQKEVIITQYRRATRQALIDAAFMKSSTLVTLQAYMLYLMSIKGIYQSDSLFILAGIAVRLARRMGLHRDGTSLGLSPFETEMRRRLWCQIAHLDTRSSDLSGTKPSMDLVLSDTRRPLNILDEDINPDMTTPPPERLGITPMVISIIKCEFSEFLRKLNPGSSCCFHWDKLASPQITMEEKDNIINQLEDAFESKYLRYCDPSEPLHVVTSIVARSSLCKMRLYTHNPHQYTDRGIKLPQRDRDIIWTNGRKLLEYGNIVLNSNISLKKYTWQSSTSYLWDTLLYVLVEVRIRKTGPEVDRTWKLIGTVFKNYPLFFQEATDAFYEALGNWTIKVWDDCAAARKANGLPDQSEPDFVSMIRRCRRPQPQVSSEDNGKPDWGKEAGTSILTPDQNQMTGFDESRINEFDSLQSYDFSNLLSFDLESSEWAQWEKLFTGKGFN